MDATPISHGPAVQGSAKSLPMAQTDARTAEGGQYLVFTLGKESCAIGILAIKEIIEYGSLTEVPMIPEAVRGVINLRGAVVPVIDLLARFGRQPSVVGRRTCIVIVDLEAKRRMRGRRPHRGCGKRSHRHRRGRDSASSLVRRQIPYRLHWRHGQGQRTIRDDSGRGGSAVAR